MGMKALMRLILFLSLATATSAWAVDLHGRSSTQVLSFLDFYNGRQIEVAEYLRFSLTGIDNAGKLALYGYGRGTQDLTNGEGFNNRLYFLYGDYRGLVRDSLDARLGRQFVNNSAGTTIIDGLQLNLKKVGPVGVTLFGGRDVVFGIDTEIGHSGNYAVGASLYLADIQGTDVDVSWFRKYDDGDIARDVVGGSFKQYLFKMVKLYGDARYDLTAKVFNEALGGVKVFPTQRLVFTGEYYQSYPTFDTTDIFSVFAVNQYREGVFRVDYFINEKYSVNGGYTRESFGDGGTADVYEVGGRWQPTEPLAIDVSVNDRHGFGGHTYGFAVDAFYDLTKKWQVAGGVGIDTFERDFFPVLPGAEHTAQRYWAAAKYQLAKNMKASGQIEDQKNDIYTNAVQGRFVFDYDF